MKKKKNIGGSASTCTTKNLTSKDEDKNCKKVIQDLYEHFKNNYIFDEYELIFSRKITNDMAAQNIELDPYHNKDYVCKLKNNKKENGNDNSCEPDGGILYFMDRKTKEILPLIITENKHQESITTCLNAKKCVKSLSLMLKGFINTCEDIYKICKLKGDYYIDNDGIAWVKENDVDDKFINCGGVTCGNACERVGKNLLFSRDLCRHHKWFPYVIFLSGPDFGLKYALGKLFHCKAIYDLNIYNFNVKHISFGDYEYFASSFLKKDFSSHTYDEMYKICYDAIMLSISFYEKTLNRKIMRENTLSKNDYK